MRKQPIEKRKKVHERYVYNLKEIEGIKLISFKENVKPNYAYFPVVFDKKKFGLNRDEVCELLAKNNIFARKYFYPLINDFDCYKEEYSSLDTPIISASSLLVSSLSFI